MIRYVEIIGPQGVGKSTLLNELIRQRTKVNRWRSYDEAILEISESARLNEFQSLKEKLLFIANKINITGYKRMGICNHLLQQMVDDEPEYLKKYECLIDAQLKCMSDFKDRVSAVNKAYLLSWHFESIQALSDLEQVKYDKPVLVDEGPFKTNYGLHLVKKDSDLKKILPSAVIYCHLNLKDNIKRINTRTKESGAISKIHNNLNNLSFKKLVQLTHDITEKNVLFLKEMGVPVMDVDMKSEQFLSAEINDFIEKSIQR